jgi:hypothetical protein
MLFYRVKNINDINKNKLSSFKIIFEKIYDAHIRE